MNTSRAVRSLLGHRLSAEDAEQARSEWTAIVEGSHPLWDNVTEPYKHTIRAFLIFFQNEILRNCQLRFDYRNGSVGNFFFAGARLFFRSLEAAIFLFSRVARIPEGSRVLPAIQTEERITLAAQLMNDVFIRGQSDISHPHQWNPHVVDKHTTNDPLPAAIRRVFYLASEGTGAEHEVQFEANATVLSALHQADMVVYGMGSLYTSICSTLILRGIGEAIATQGCPSVLILNGGHDRETMIRSKNGDGPMTASDVIQAVTDALNRSFTIGGLDHSPEEYMTAVIYPKNGRIELDEEKVMGMGVKEVVGVDAIVDHKGNVRYKPDALVCTLTEVLERERRREIDEVH